MDVEIRHCESATMARDLISMMNGGLLDADKLRSLEAMTGVGSDLWIGLFDGVPVCAWGLVPPSLISDRAYLWLYCTEGVERNKFMFIRWSQRVMDELKQMYPKIHGVCEVSNPRAIRWMKLLGAEFSYPHDGIAPFVIEAKHG
jgi:hypothetical protein